jgi:tetratricopeptide (TPR) repeat protein
MFMADGTLLNEESIENARNRFYGYLKTFESEKFQFKKPDKKVKQLYDDIHQSFLTKYDLNNSFEHVFYNGTYNCVSGTALYALAFEHLQIPYTIKEKPTHVYLIAYPDSHRIIVETTTPAGGYLMVSPQFKQGYVKLLTDQKIISGKEAASQSTDAIFDKYYFGEQENITITQLAGLQYYNAGLYLHEQQKYEQSYTQFEKAYILYPSERVSYMLMASLNNAFISHEKKDTTHALLLGKLSRHKALGIKDDMIEGEFERAVQKLLFENSQKEETDKYYSTLISVIEDSTLRREIDFIYRFENGRYSFNQGKFSSAIGEYERCLKIKPNHQDAARILIGSIAQSLSNNSSSEAIAALESYAITTPSLLKHNVFLDMLANSYLGEMATDFQFEKASAGEKLRTTFETFASAQKELKMNAHFVGEAYSAAAVYYFRKGLTNKAKAAIDQGLKFSPNNYQLLTRKKMLTQ